MVRVRFTIRIGVKVIVSSSVRVKNLLVHSYSFSKWCGLPPVGRETSDQCNLAFWSLEC